MSRRGYLGLKLRAQAWLLIGLDARALTVFDRMLSRWPDDAYALASRAHLNGQAQGQGQGQAHGQAGRTAQALTDAQRLTVLAPDDARAWFNLGFLLETAERWDEAAAAFGRATTLSPQLDRAWYGLGLALIRQQRFDEAAAALKRNTELQPMSPYGWYQLARVHLDRNDPEEAAKIIRHLKGFEPTVAAQLEREAAVLAMSAGA